MPPPLVGDCWPETSKTSTIMATPDPASAASAPNTPPKVATDRITIVGRDPELRTEDTRRPSRHVVLGHRWIMTQRGGPPVDRSLRRALACRSETSDGRGRAGTDDVRERHRRRPSLSTAGVCSAGRARPGALSQLSNVQDGCGPDLGRDLPHLRSAALMLVNREHKFRLISVLSTAGDLGRSFKVTSALPSVLLVVYLAALVSTGGFQSDPSVSAVVDAVEGVTIAQAAILAGVSLVVGLMLHPLQFGLTQVLEGYWGTGPVPTALMKVRQRGHLEARRRILVAEGVAQSTVEELSEQDGSPVDRAAASLDGWNSSRGRSRYPERPERVMPTALGNVLRRYEDLAGSQYGLDAITVAPHLSLIAPSVHLDYLDDRRNQLDSTVRYVLIWLVCLVATILCFWRHGFWLALALVPYVAIVLSYRGAVSAAQSYGIALSTIIDLNRHALYAELHLPRPEDTLHERNSVGPWTVALLRWETPPVPFEYPPSDSK